jgi:hypothetical protein
MSQSDYIRYKKIYRELKEYDSTPEKLPVVFESGKYIAYKEFSFAIKETLSANLLTGKRNFCTNIFLSKINSFDIYNYF